MSSPIQQSSTRSDLTYVPILGKSYPTNVLYYGVSGARNSVRTCDKKRQTFTGIPFPGITFPGITFQGITFPGKTFPGITFPGKTFPGQTFEGKIFKGKIFQGNADIALTRFARRRCSSRCPAYFRPPRGPDEAVDLLGRVESCRIEGSFSGETGHEEMGEF